MDEPSLNYSKPIMNIRYEAAAAIIWNQNEHSIDWLQNCPLNDNLTVNMKVQFRAKNPHDGTG